MKYYGISDKGKVRIQNQDSIYVPEKNEYNLYIIADGMGGAKAGDVASIKAIEYIKEYIKNNYVDQGDTKIKEMIRESLIYANEKVYSLSEENKEYEGMGTTVIVVLVYKNKMYIGHIGDSRLYRIRNNFIRKITKDHSYVQKLIDDKTITKKEAKDHPRRNMLLKALGCEPIVEPDVMMKKIEPNDYVILCTDGLTNLVKDKEILLVTNNLKQTKKICEKLVDLANERGGYDNISVIVIHNDSVEV